MSTTTFLRRRTVEAKTGLSRSTIYAKVKDGTFPSPIKIGARSVAWVEADVEAWQAAQVAATRAAA